MAGKTPFSTHNVQRSTRCRTLTCLAAFVLINAQSDHSSPVHEEAVAPTSLHASARVGLRREPRSLAALAIDGHALLDSADIVHDERRSNSKPLEQLGSELQQVGSREQIHRVVDADGSVKLHQHLPRHSRISSVQDPNVTQINAQVENDSTPLTEAQAAEEKVETLNATVTNMTSMIDKLDKKLVDKQGVMRSMSDTLACLLLGTTMLLTSIVYLTNAPDPDVVAAIWKTLSGGMSIFAAIMMYYAQKSAWNHFVFGPEFKLEEEMEEGEHAGQKLAMQAWIRLVVNYGIVSILSFWCLNNPKYLAVFGELGSHIVGFTAADAFGTMQEMPPFEENAYLATLLVVPCFLLGLATSRFGSYCRSKFEGNREKVTDESHEEWMRKCDEYEKDYIAFAVGLLMSQVCRFAILGHVPPLEGTKGKKRLSLGQTMSLLACSGAFGAAVVGIGVVVHIHGINIHGGRAFHETVLGMVQCCCSMSMAWCITFWGQWSIRHALDHFGHIPKAVAMADKIYQALSFTPLMFLCIYLSCAVADYKYPRYQSCQYLVSGFILVIGLCWEKSFVGAMDCLQESRNMDADESANMTIASNLVIFCFVVPAWGMFIQPKAEKLSEEREGRNHAENLEEEGAGGVKERDVKDGEPEFKEDEDVVYDEEEAEEDMVAEG